jgi:hypothetical protein
MNFKILAPTRIFGNNELGQIEFNLQSIIDDYYLKGHDNNVSSPSYRVQLPFQNSTTSSNLFQLNDINNDPSIGMIDVTFYGSVLNQQQNGTTRTILPESVNIYSNFKKNVFLFLEFTFIIK